MNSQPVLHDVFISYSHGQDGPIAASLRDGLQKIAKPWFKLRSLDVFLDQRSLEAVPELWPGILQHLQQSRWFILVASASAANSTWVQRETEWWLENRGTASFLIILARDHVVWDSTTGDFDWSTTNAVPLSLTKRFSEEPYYLDLRSLHTSSRLDLRNPVFRDVLLSVASSVRQIPKELLEGKDITEHRRAQALAWFASICLLCLAVTAGVFALRASDEARRAIEQRAQSDARRMAAESVTFAKSNFRLACHLAIAAYELRKLPVTHAALVNMVERASPTVARLQVPSYVTAAQFSDDGLYLAIADASGTVSLVTTGDWSVRAQSSIGRSAALVDVWIVGNDTLVAVGSDGSVTRWRIVDGQLVQQDQIILETQIQYAALDKVGRRLAVGFSDTVRLWDLSRRLPIGSVLHKDNITTIAIDRTGRLVAVGGDATSKEGVLVAGASRMPESDQESNERFVLMKDADGKGSYVSIYNPLQPSSLTHLKGHLGSLIGAKFSQNSQVLVTADSYGIVNRWSVKDRLLIGKEQASSKEVLFYTAATTTSGNDFVIAGEAVAAKISSEQAWKELPNLENSSSLDVVAVHPDGAAVVLGSTSGDHIWVQDLRLPSSIATGFFDKGQRVGHIALSEDSTVLASGGYDDYVRIWGVPSGMKLGSKKVPSDWVSALAVDPHGRRVLIAIDDGVVYEWQRDEDQLVTVRPRKVFDLSNSGNDYNYVSSVKYISGGAQAVLLVDERIERIDLSTGNRLSVYDEYSEVEWFMLADSPTNSPIAAGVLHDVLVIGDLAKGTTRTLSVPGWKEWIEKGETEIKIDGLACNSSNSLCAVSVSFWSLLQLHEKLDLVVFNMADVLTLYDVKDVPYNWVSHAHLAFEPTGSGLWIGEIGLRRYDVMTRRLSNVRLSADAGVVGLVADKDGKWLAAAVDEGIALYPWNRKVWMRRLCSLSGSPMSTEEIREFLPEEAKLPCQNR
jgi:WD40 repeat protein